MSVGSWFASTEIETREIAVAMANSVALSVRLPDWPFRAEGCYAFIFEFDTIMNGSFGAVLGALAARCEDSAVMFAAGVPQPSSDKVSLHVGRIPTRELGVGYVDLLRHPLDAQSRDEIRFSADLLCIVGSSLAWALWAERDWEIGVLLTPDSAGPWQDAAFANYNRVLNLADVRGPEGWSAPLAEDDIRAFWSNVRDKGSGP